VRIWIINPYDNLPGEGVSQRFGTLCRELTKRGHEVVWWSSVWSHLTKSRRSLKQITGAGVRGPNGAIAKTEEGWFVRLVEAPPYQRNVGWARVRNHRAFGANLRRDGEMEMHAGRVPEVVLFSWPPMDAASAALSWRERCSCAVLVDLMDAWPDNFVALAPQNRLVQSLVRALLGPLRRRTRAAFSRLDGASAQSAAFADFIRSYGGPATVHVCYLGAEGVGTALTSRHETNDDLRLVYVGAMGRVYDLETLVRAVARLRGEGLAVRLDLAGEGSKRAALERLAADLGVSDFILFHGYLRGEVLRTLLAAGDLGVIPMFPSSLVAVPYKAGDYLAAGLPILNSLPGELQAGLDRFRCGAYYCAGDIESLLRQMRVYACEPDRVARESIGARAYFAERFDRARTYPAWAQWIEDMVVERRG